MRIRCQPPSGAGWAESATDRQERLAWFDQRSLSLARMTLFGLGVGSLAASQLVRKGVGQLDLVDHDVVAPSNLNRTFYFPEDVGEPKAFALARNLKRAAVARTVIRAFPVRAEDYLRRETGFDVAVCLVDSEESREFVSRAALAMQRPCIFGGASEDGNSCRVFVQEPSRACYRCSGGFGGSERCDPSPAISDIQGVLASVIVYAIDTLLMARPRHWNFRQSFLSGGDYGGKVERDPNCKACGYKYDA